MGRKKKKNAARTFEEAKKRYISGFCPDCGEKTQHRKELADFFCHHCHRSWTFKIIEEKFGVKPAVALPVATIIAAPVVRKGIVGKLRFWSFWKW